MNSLAVKPVTNEIIQVKTQIRRFCSCCGAFVRGEDYHCTMRPIELRYIIGASIYVEWPYIWKTNEYGSGDGYKYFLKPIRVILKNGQLFSSREIVGENGGSIYVGAFQTFDAIELHEKNRELWPTVEQAERAVHHPDEILYANFIG
jgi:hypothetical protein